MVLLVLWTTGRSFTEVMVRLTVAMLLSAVPSLTLKVKLSLPK